jgi:hypothetical protein
LKQKGEHKKKRSVYHILGKALAQSNVVALLNKVARSKSILVGVTRGETLVGHVEESKVALLLDNIADLAPLLLAGVNTRWVVSASVQQDNAVLGGSLQVSNETVKVETDGVLVVVTVCTNLQTRVLEDRVVVGPAGSGQVELFCVRIEALEESTANSEGASSRD